VNDDTGLNNVESDHLCVEQESSQCVSLASKMSSTSFMFMQLLKIPRKVGIPKGELKL